jgi:hypothetical protein
MTGLVPLSKGAAVHLSADIQFLEMLFVCAQFSGGLHSLTNVLLHDRIACVCIVGLDNYDNFNAGRQRRAALDNAIASVGANTTLLDEPQSTV